MSIDDEADMYIKDGKSPALIKFDDGRQAIIMPMKWRSV